MVIVSYTMSIIFLRIFGKGRFFAGFVNGQLFLIASIFDGFIKLPIMYSVQIITDQKGDGVFAVFGAENDMMDQIG